MIVMMMAPSNELFHFRILMAAVLLWLHVAADDAVMVSCGQPYVDIASHVSYTVIDCGCSATTVFQSSGAISNVSIVAVNSAVTFSHSHGDVRTLSFRLQDYSDAACRPNNVTNLFTIMPAAQGDIPNVSNVSIDMDNCTLSITTYLVITTPLIHISPTLSEHISISIVDTIVTWTAEVGSPIPSSIALVGGTCLFASRSTVYHNISVTCRRTSLSVFSVPELLAAIRIGSAMSGTLVRAAFHDSYWTMRSAVEQLDIRSDFFFFRLEGAGESSYSEQSGVSIAASNFSAVFDVVLAHRLILFELSGTVVLRNVSIDLDTVVVSMTLRSSSDMTLSLSVVSDYGIGGMHGVQVTASNTVFEAFANFSTSRPFTSDGLNAVGFAFSNITSFSGFFDNITIVISLRGAYLSNRIKALALEYLYASSSVFLWSVGRKGNDNAAISNGALVSRNVSIVSSFGNIVVYSGPLIGTSISFFSGITMFYAVAVNVSVVIEGCAVDMLPGDMTTTGTLCLSGPITAPVMWNVTAAATLMALATPIRESDIFDSVDVLYRDLVRLVLLSAFPSLASRNISMSLHNSSASVTRNVPAQRFATARLISSSSLLSLGVLSDSRLEATNCQAEVGLFGAPPRSNTSNSSVVLRGLNGLVYLFAYVTKLQSVSIVLGHSTMRFLEGSSSSSFLSQDRHAIAQPVVPISGEPLLPVVFLDCSVSLSDNLFVGYQALFPASTVANSSLLTVCVNLWRSQDNIAIVESAMKDTDIGLAVGFNVSQRTTCQDFTRNNSLRHAPARSTTQAVSGAVTLAVAITGASFPGTVLCVQRSFAAASMMTICSAGGDSGINTAVDVKFSDSPTGMIVAGSALSGAVVGNVMLLVSIALVSTLWGLWATSTLSGDCNSAATMLGAALRRARLPSSFAWAYAFLLQSTISSSVATLGSGSSALIGALGLIVFVVPIVWCCWRIFESRLAIVATPRRLQQSNGRSLARRAIEFLFEPSSVWSVRRAVEMVKWEMVMQCYGGLIEEYRNGSRFYAFIDLTCSVLCGVVGGSVAGGWLSCAIAPWIVLALCSSLLLFAIVRRPCVSRFGNALLAMNGGMTVVCLILTIVDDASEASDIVALVQTVTSLTAVLTARIAAAIVDRRPLDVQVKQGVAAIFVPTPLGVTLRYSVQKLPAAPQNLITLEFPLAGGGRLVVSDESYDRLRTLVSQICEARSFTSKHLISEQGRNSKHALTRRGFSAFKPIL